MKAVFAAFAFAVLLLAPPAAAEELFVSKQLTHADDKYFGIEGPAVDAEQNLYVVNFSKPGTIGRVRAGQNRSVVYRRLPPGSIGNGIRFDRAGRMFVADHKKHNIFVFDPGQEVPRVYFYSRDFNQPNDLAISADGTLYASDPRIRKGQHGKIWRITPARNGSGNGGIMQSEWAMVRPNGLDLSPDGRTLYVGESDTQKIWAYRIDNDKLAERTLVKTFDDGELDGLRTDVDGRILVARQKVGKVTLLKPDGTVVREISTRGLNPSNLTFGGPNGRTVFVTQAAGGFVEQFTSDRPGREICAQPQATGC